MLADVAQAGSAQQGIAERVQHNVTVGMRLEAALMGHRHPAQHQASAVLEGMHIETLPDSDHMPLDCR
jgi:hypothetical protein